MAALTVVPICKVQTAIKDAKSRLTEQREYNTNFHTLSEITREFPNITSCAPEKQPWILLGPWLDLILTSRGLKDEDIHRIVLPGCFLVLLSHARQIVTSTTTMSSDDEEDLAEYFPKVSATGLAIDELLANTDFFVRLDMCSLKDARSRTGPVKSIKDLYMRLATSVRAAAGIDDLRKANLPVTLYLIPWDLTIQPELEYRVFCSPSVAGDSNTEMCVTRMTALSQYRWFEPWIHREKSNEEQHYITMKLLQNCQGLHQQIVRHPAFSELLGSRGFTFDVVEDPSNQSVRLIELNDFGAQSGCGSCLYHWIRDARLLYGLKDEVEFCVAF